MHILNFINFSSFAALARIVPQDVGCIMSQMVRRAIYEPDSGTRRVSSSLITGSIPVISAALKAKEMDVR